MVSQKGGEGEDHILEKFEKYWLSSLAKTPVLLRETSEGLNWCCSEWGFGLADLQSSLPACTYNCKLSKDSLCQGRHNPGPEQGRPCNHVATAVSGSIAAGGLSQACKKEQGNVHSPLKRTYLPAFA